MMEMMQTMQRALLPLAFALLVPQIALADEPNPAAEACAGKADGNPCSSEKIVQEDGRAVKKTEPGTCQPDECCKLDYSSGVPPKSTCGPCLVCKPGVPVTDTTEPTSATGTEPPRADTGNPPPVTPNEKRGCSIGGYTKAEQPWWLLGLAFVLRRRRR
jgi:hypothetical protein